MEINHKYKKFFVRIISENFTSFKNRQIGKIGDRSQKLKAELDKSSPNNKIIIQNALECLYEFRNEIFHQGKADNGLTKQAEEFLSEIISACFQNL